MNAMIEVTLTGSWTASAAGITVDYESRSRGAPICDLARKLVAAGHDPERVLSITRNGTLCFEPIPLGIWAGMTVSEPDNAPHEAQVKKWKRFERPPAWENAKSAAQVTA